MTKEQQLREPFLEWMKEFFGHGGNPGTDEMDGMVADYWINVIRTREEAIMKWIDELKVLEVGFDSTSLMWKQRINERLEDVKKIFQWCDGEIY